MRALAVALSLALVGCASSSAPPTAPATHPAEPPPPVWTAAPPPNVPASGAAKPPPASPVDKPPVDKPPADKPPAGEEPPDPKSTCKTTDATFAVPVALAGSVEAQPVAFALPIEGHIDTNAVRRVMQRQRHCYRRCYERGLAQDEALKGKIAIRFVIAAGTGAVKSVEDAGSELADARVIHCVMREIKGLTFPAPGKDVSVVYPMIFST